MASSLVYVHTPDDRSNYSRPDIDRDRGHRSARRSSVSCQRRSTTLSPGVADDTEFELIHTAVVAEPLFPMGRPTFSSAAETITRREPADLRGIPGRSVVHFDREIVGAGMWSVVRDRLAEADPETTLWASDRRTVHVAGPWLLPPLVRRFHVRVVLLWKGIRDAVPAGVVMFHERYLATLCFALPETLRRRAVAEAAHQVEQTLGGGALRLDDPQPQQLLAGRVQDVRGVLRIR